MDRVVINAIAQIEKPAGVPPVVRLFADHQRLVQFELADAQALADWLQAQLNSGIGAKITAGLLDGEALSAVMQTASGLMTLQFSPRAAKDFVAEMRQR